MFLALPCAPPIGPLDGLFVSLLLLQLKVTSSSNGFGILVYNTTTFSPADAAAQSDQLRLRYLTVNVTNGGSIPIYKLKLLCGRRESELDESFARAS